ncbi:MAG: hypothetical protein ACREUV_09065 [Burkholderiales bacterium]
MHCHLLIPALLEPAASVPGLQLPALRTLLARAATGASEKNMESWLCQAFGVQKQQDWPIAALMLAAEGINPGAAYWLRADPVNLQVDRGQLLLMDSRAFAITQDEANQFIHALNTQFADRGCVFHAPHPRRWFLRLEHVPRLQTTPLNQVLGKNVDDFLAAGEEGLYWQGITNEIQMLLHEHALNTAREARGELLINSIWLWGGGCLPQLSQKPYARIWADDALTQSLALAGGTPCHALPAGAGDWLKQADLTGEHLMVFDHLQTAALYHDLVRWKIELTKLETAWFAPLLAALKRGKLAAVTIEADGKSFAVTRKDLWKWWRRSGFTP